MASRQPKRHKIKINTNLVSATGWTWLIVSLLLALFFGGAVRALLSERQVRQWIERTWSKENPAYHLSFSVAKVELAEGWRPRFGLRVSGLTLTPKEPCQHRLKLQVGDLFLPGPLSIIWGGPLHFGQLQANKVNVDYLTCAKPEVESTSGAASTAPPIAAAKTTQVQSQTKAETFLRQRWPIELERTAHWIDGLRLSEVRIQGGPAPLDELWIPDLDLTFAADGSAANLKASIKFKGQIDQALAGNALQMVAVAKASSLDASLYIPIREGRVSVHALADFATMNYSGEFNLDFVPAASVLEILKQTEVITDPITLKRAWLAGQGRWQGSLFAPSKVETIYGDNLKLSGDAGRIQIEGLELKPQNHSLVFKPFHVQLDDFSLRYLLEALGRKGYTGVISDFGRLTGQLNVQSAQDIEFRGELEDLEINFSRQSVRVPQKVSQMRWALDLKKDRVSGLVKDIELEEGLLRGQTSFNLDRDVLNGVFQVKIDELKFRPQVQKLMAGGTISPLALYGQGQLKEGQVHQWSGEVGSREIVGDNWNVEGLKVRSEFANQQMILQVRAQKMFFAQENSFWQQFQPAFSKVEKNETGLKLQHLSARIEMVHRWLKWNNATATSIQGRMLLATTGKIEEGHIEATLNLETSKRSRWQILGPWQKFQVNPLPQ